MLTLSDAVFFLSGKKVIKQMLFNEFEALLDGVVDAPELKNAEVTAAFLQIDDQLKLRGLVCFLIRFTGEGAVERDWNLPLQQLLQSAGRGPDLGAGKIRLVCRSQCTVPWHQNSLWDPQGDHIQALVAAASNNRLGLIASDESWDEGDSWEVPGLGLGDDPVEPPMIMAEPPVIAAKVEIPILDIPTIEPAVAAPDTTNNTQSEPQEPDDSAQLNAMKSAFSVKIDRLQKSYDELDNKHKTVVDSLKSQAKEQVTQLGQDFKADIVKRDEQIDALKVRIEGEQSRYSDLREQQADMAANSQLEREELLTQMQSNEDVGSEKIVQLQQAFKKELQLRMDAEVSKANNGLAMREVELFYRDEQLALLRDDLTRMKTEKQAVLAESGHKILGSLEDNGVTLVAFHLGVGHITIPSEDVGRYLDQRTAYLAERCQVSITDFNLWQGHYNSPHCTHSDCNITIPKVDLVSAFKVGISDRCTLHATIA